MGHKSLFALLRKCKNCKSFRLFHVPLFSYEIFRINVHMNSAINLGLEKVIRPTSYKNRETAKNGQKFDPLQIHSLNWFRFHPASGNNAWSEDANWQIHSMLEQVLFTQGLRETVGIWSVAYQGVSHSSHRVRLHPSEVDLFEFKARIC